MHSIISVLPPVTGISRTFWQTLESCTENFFGGWKLSLSMILRIFLIFGDLSLDDSYKLNSYKKSVYYTHRVFYYAQIHTQCIALVNRSKIWTLNHGKFTKWLKCPDRLLRHESFQKKLRNFILILPEMPYLNGLNVTR